MRKIGFIFCVLAFLLIKSAYSQFTYFNVNAGYEGLSFYNLTGHNLSGIRSFSTSLSFTSRVKRHLGVGGQISMPLSQTTKFSFKGINTSSGSSFSEFYITDPSRRYYPQKYDYDFSYNLITSVYLRLYLDRVANFYFDFQLSHTQLTTSFIFYRPYVPEYFSDFGSGRPEIPEENIDFYEERNLFSPGFKFGLTPHITDNLFIDFNLGLDFLLFGEKSFSYSVPYKYDIVNERHDYVNFENQVQGTKVIFSTRLGIGYYF